MNKCAKRLWSVILKGRGDGLLRSLFLLVVGAAASPFLANWYSDFQKARITFQYQDPTIAQFGALQILQDGRIVDERRLDPLADGIRVGKTKLAVESGFYDIRLRVLGQIFLVDRLNLGQRQSLQIGDIDLHPAPFFPDDDFLRVPAGAFDMGDNLHPRDPTFKSAEGKHHVMLGEFRLRSFPVTTCEYDLFARQKNHQLLGPEDPCSSEAGRLPARDLTWQDAIAFCDWLTERKHNGHKYKLPTEAQYERAMRLSGSQRYPWGEKEFDDSEPDLAKANYAFVWSHGKPTPLPVRSYPPTANGFYDLSGNVWEWTSDWFQPYASKRDTTLDPRIEPPTESDKSFEIVVRGGSCEDKLFKLENGYRGHADPKIMFYNVGFRPVME
jgi:sulfatase modifying factor 1